MRMRKSAVVDQELIARIAKSKVRVKRAGEDRKRVSKAGASPSLPPFLPFFVSAKGRLFENKRITPCQRIEL